MTILRTVRHPASLVMVVVCLSLPAWCQGTRQLQDQLNSVFKGKVGLLRNFYSGSDLRCDQNGVLRDAEAAQGPWTLAGVEITGVEVTAQGLEDLRGAIYADLHGADGTLECRCAEGGANENLSTGARKQELQIALPPCTHNLE